MKEIKLSKGKVALVDDADYKWLNQWKWTFNGGRYAVRMPSRKLGKRKFIFMHHEVLSLHGIFIPKGMQTDHINNNGLDNQYFNLRICNDSQNKANIPIKRNNTSGYKGVHWNKQNKKWHVQIRIGGTTRFLGYYDDIKEAAEVYDKKAIEVFGEFAYTNRQNSNITLIL